MAKFKLHDRVMKDGEWTVRTVHEIREEPAAETLYSTQLGNDFATRIWAKESELEPEPEKLPAGKRRAIIRKVGNRGKVKVVSGHKTITRRRALKRDHNPKGKGTGKSIRRK